MEVPQQQAAAGQLSQLQPELEASHIDSLIESARDQVTLSQQAVHELSHTPEPVVKRDNPNQAPIKTRHVVRDRSAAQEQQSLSAQVEMLSSGDTLQDTFDKTSIMDKTTYLIARRLLLEGKELHVVARKLELPVSEIRLLDRLIRAEQGGEEEPELELSDSQPKIIRRQQKLDEFVPGQHRAGGVNLDKDIEREVALL